MRYCLEGLCGEDGQDRAHLLVEVEELVLLDLGCDVDSRLLGLVRGRSGLLLEVISLDLNRSLRGRLRVGVLQEEVQVRLDLGVGGRLDVIGRHLLLVPAEIRKLRLHVLLL